MSDECQIDNRILLSLKGKTISLYYTDPKFGVFGKTGRIIDADSSTLFILDYKSGKNEGISIDKIIRFEVENDKG